MTWILFYKRMVTLGGAEVLLNQHYSWLKEQGEEVKVVTFQAKNLERISISQEDLIVLKGSGVTTKTFALIRELKKTKSARVICHSGYIELGIAAWVCKIAYSIFIHQPTTMSFNEQDKFAIRFWPRFKKFARKDDMYWRLCEQRASFSFIKRLYIELRSYLSQFLLSNAKARFVLSDYAVREKREIFDLKVKYLSGAITLKQLDELAKKPKPKSLTEQIELVSVSRIDENKRIEILIMAVAELKTRGYNIRLKLGGKGPAVENLMKLVKKLNVNEAIEFLGFVPEVDIQSLYRDMDLFVTIDWADYRITTYEVLAQNRRVIISNDTDIDPKLLLSGYLFASTPEPIALANCIESALSAPVNWEQKQLVEYLKAFTWPLYFERIRTIVDGQDA